MGDEAREPVPASYKAWVFGSKLVGVLVFAVGIEMLARGEPLWAGLLLLAGAAVVLAPVRSPEGWRRSDEGRV
jgi:hypothetical protein